MVGLLSVSDFAYATKGGTKTRSECLTSNISLGKNNWENNDCSNNDWLNFNGSYWTISPYATKDNASYVIAISSSGVITPTSAFRTLDVYPTVYLKSNTIITDGDGSITSPYIIELGE